MALSKITASKIVDAVSNDAKSRRRVNSWTGSGVVRNFAMANAPWMDPTDRSSNAYKWSCDGIAEATTAAINTALKKDPPQDSRRGLSYRAGT